MFLRIMIGWQCARAACLQDGCVYVDHMEAGDSTGATLHAAHNEEQIKSEP